ncbi:MAG: NuoM family protein [Candidatus Gastranaerophilales bacterium]|nr:NuoM family protein [Candidatus Gastranaerophilales bacterium]
MEHLSLNILLFLPLIFCVIIAGPWFPNHEVQIRRTAKAFASLLFVYSIFFVALFDFTKIGYQLIETIEFANGQRWFEPIGASFELGIDGLSLILVVLTSFIVLLASIASKPTIRKRHKLYYSMLFLLTFAILGVFLAKDLFLFFLFWELELIPMYFLISIWGSGRKEYSAMKFVLYTFLGSIFMLASILALYFYNFGQTGNLTFDISAYNAINAPFILSLLCFIGFFIAFAVKVPIVPFHTWLPDAHVDAPTPISMILAGILLKMGGYGLIRFNLGFFPEIIKFLAPILVILGVINIIYGALIALVQDDLKKLVAYSSVSHMGIVLLGLGALSVVGVSGAVFQMVAHGVISAGLFMAVGIIYLRCHTRQISEFGGLGQVMPRAMYFTLIITLASLGLPLLIGFAAETLVFYGAFTSNFASNAILSNIPIQVWSVIGIFGIILTAAYLLWMIQKVFYGNMFEKWKNIHDLTPHEVVVMLAIVTVIVVFGLYPTGVTHIFIPTVKGLLSNIIL